jgi:hypothetical protein
MKRGSLAATVAVAALATAPTAALAASVLGSSGQTSDQGIQSTQQGKNAVSAPNQTTIGASNNKFAQNSGNTDLNAQAIGVGDDPSGDALVATPDGPGFAQQSSQGVNSLQNGGRVQNQANVLGSTQIVGDGILGGPSTIIGGVSQSNRQAANSNQIGATSGHRTQTSTNALGNAQIVSSEVIIGTPEQANSQAVNSAQSIPSGKKTTGSDIVGTGLPGVNRPGLTVGTPTGPVEQDQTNTTGNAQLIIG